MFYGPSKEMKKINFEEIKIQSLFFFPLQIFIVRIAFTIFLIVYDIGFVNCNTKIIFFDNALVNMAETLIPSHPERKRREESQLQEPGSL